MRKQTNDSDDQKSETNNTNAALASNVQSDTFWGGMI